MKVSFEFERETKRTYRFKEVSEEPVIGTLYVQQSAFDEKPERIEVTIKVTK